MKRINLQKAKTQVARPTTIRDINRRIILSYVRDRAPISRAEIARETALHRSTVSVIIEDLLRDELIVEIGTAVSTGGRKPTLFDLMTGKPVALAVDITPRTTTLAMADLAGELLDRETFSTSPDMEFMTSQIIKRVKKLAQKHKGNEFEIGMSVPGLVDQKAGKIFHVPYFDWRDWDICSRIERETGLSVTVENDANATALAELWFGHEMIRKTDTFVMVLVAEGIGTGLIFDGQIYRGENGAGGEFGHMIVGSDAPASCSCGSTECWEAYASEKALIARYRARLRSGELRQNDINSGDIIELAVNGEKNALEAFKETAHYLADGLSNLTVGLSPQVMVISGKITKAWPLLAAELERVAKRGEKAGLPDVSILPSTLGDSPTLIGAIGLVLAREFGSVS
jgi:predicted NBD/HSP70 family sugar kinase